MLQAEGGLWVKQIRDKSQDSYSTAVSETMHVLASAVDRDNCGNLMGGVRRAESLGSLPGHAA